MSKNTETKYDKFNFVSPCCNGFNYYDNNNILCSICGKIIKTLDKDEKITINVKFNMTNDDNNISGDIVQNFMDNAKKYAHDETCEKIYKECPKCKHNECRYIRNPMNDIVYICTNCRETFM